MNNNDQGEATRDMRESLIRIEERLKTMDIKLTESIVRQEKDHSALEVRVRALEKDNDEARGGRTMLAAICAIVGSAIGSVITLLADKMFHSNK